MRDNTRAPTSYLAMASIPVTLHGALYDLQNRTTQQVVLIGEASLTGLSVGGGPVIPPGQPPSGNPPGIWGGANQPFPTPPIANVPGAPGYRPPGNPPGIWGGPIDPYPGHPLPEPPGKPEEPVAPPVNWKPIWAGPEHGWVVVGIIDPSVDHPVPSA